MQLRDYQSAAVSSVYQHLRDKDTNPCVVIPTGGGKTAVLATICADAAKYNRRALIITHVKELLQQSADTLAAMSDIDVGVYSAGLKKRDTDQAVIVAGIQSVYRRADELGPFDLIIVDEAHTIPATGDGMYRRFLSDCEMINPKVSTIGLTATPYRMSSGMICSPKNILHEVCYEVGVKELIDRGYICPLISKGSLARLDVSGLHKRGGEFVDNEVQALMDQTELVASACAEITQHTQDRKSVLVFCAGVDHAKHIAACLPQPNATVFGETSSNERAQTLEDFKQGRIKYLVNVNVLTTGFDAPNIDCVVMVRPTASPGLYYQMVGRGFRIFPSKENTLVLDFGGNVERHGPVDDIQVKKPREGNGVAPCKQCPKCQLIVPAGVRVCECGYKWPEIEVKHEPKASNAAILSSELFEPELTTYDVQDIKYLDYKKHGSSDDHPHTLRVEYIIQYGDEPGAKRLRFSEYVNIENQSKWARDNAKQWWLLRSNAHFPESAKEAETAARAGCLAKALTITVKTGGKYPEIVGTSIDVKPDWREPGEDPIEESDDEWDLDFETPF